MVVKRQGRGRVRKSRRDGGGADERRRNWRITESGGAVAVSHGGSPARCWRAFLLLPSDVWLFTLIVVSPNAHPPIPRSFHKAGPICRSFPQATQWHIQQLRPTATQTIPFNSTIQTISINLRTTTSLISTPRHTPPRANTRRPTHSTIHPSVHSWSFPCLLLTSL